jgi:hypothetical protein
MMKDIDITHTRLTKLQKDFEEQVIAADTMAAENQARVVELKVGYHTFLCHFICCCC